MKFFIFMTSLKHSFFSWSTLCSALLSLISAIALYYIFFLFDLYAQNERGGIIAMLNGTAVKPYIYRSLMPWLINILDYFLTTPLSIESKFFLAKTLSLVFLAGFFVYCFLFARIYAKTYNIHILYFPLFALFLLYYSLGFSIKIYDFPGLFFFTACLYAIYKHQSFLWFYCLFALATANKETSIFIFFIYCIINFPANCLLLRFWLNVVLLVSTYLFIRLETMLFYVWQSGDDILFLSFLPQFYNMFVLHWWNSAGLALIALFLCFGWRKKPLFVKQLSVLIPIYFILYVIGSTPTETRVFIDITFVFTLLFIDSFVRIRDLYRDKAF